MAEVSNPWDTLHHIRTDHDRLATAAKDLSTTCKATHNTTHIIQCAECYPRLLEEARTHLITTGERYSDRPLLVHDLAKIFLDTPYPPPTASADPFHAASQAINKARDANILSMLGNSLAVRQFATSADSAMTEAEFRVRTAEGEHPRALLADLLGAAVRRKEIRSRDVERQVERLEEAVARGDEEAKLGVLMEVLFSSSAAGAADEGAEFMSDGKAVAPDTKDAQAVLARLRAGQPLEAVLRQALRERDADEGEGSKEREKRAKRLLELRRGKAAHAAAEEKKKMERERRAGGGDVEARAELPEGFYERPPHCAAVPGGGCANDPVGEGGLICCEICLLEALVRDRARPTYFCAEHVEGAFDKHIQHAHDPCAAPLAMCVSEQNGAAPPSWDSAVVCKDCLYPSRRSPESGSHDNPPGSVTIYCTAECAAADTQRHEKLAHFSGGSLLACSFVDELKRLREEYGLGGDGQLKRER